MDAVFSAIAGSVLVAILAKWAITKALRDLEKLSEKVQSILQSLAGISVKLEQLAHHEDILNEHTKKIVYLEAVSKKKI